VTVEGRESVVRWQGEEGGRRQQTPMTCMWLPASAAGRAHRAWGLAAGGSAPCEARHVTRRD
jgi:hypothetical protein